MASSGLQGSFPLTREGINNNVTRTSPGAFALGYRRENTFYPKYVGRSDLDVNDRLHDHIGERPRFKFEYYDTAKAAFEKECRLYHDFKEYLDNKIHLRPSAGADWKCPRCDKYG